MDNLILVGKKLPTLDPARLSKGPDWKQCDPAFIRNALKNALGRPSGGWYVVDASRSITEKPRMYQILERQYVAYRAAGKIIVARHSCPHLGAPLSWGKVKGDKLVCPWHGLGLPSPDHDHWKPLTSLDDGVLTWVQIPSPEEEPTDRPILPKRPDFFIDAVIRKEAQCEAGGLLANRLDPWHGAHYHPHTFARLSVTDITPDLLTVRVAYRMVGRLCIEVDATFHSPEPRTIVMTIIDGEGKGSVVETHSTPISPGKSAVVEATLATSERAGFKKAMQVSWLVRAFMKRAAHRLWVEDVAYAERAYGLQKGLIK